MTADQVEYSLITAACAFSWLLGLGWVDIGMSESNKKRLRWTGPLGTACGLFLLASSYLM